MAGLKNIFGISLCICAISLLPKNINAENEYIINPDVSLGRMFDGIGAISGGGATSKLLVNYPEPQRTQILDYLFKPNWGASLQILKVEIGGDSQSSEGTESSHMHEEWDENYHRGYEWWLMKEAKKRNPTIKLYGLPWGFPRWVSKGVWWPYKFPNRTADYITRWIDGAKHVHNLDINYIGIWNEKPYDLTYVKVLRHTLDSRGYSDVKIVAADLIGFDSWDVVKDINMDPEFSRVVDIVGGHYTGTWTTDEAKTCGKPLWSSEDYSTSDNEDGGGCMARILNQNYVNGLMTSTIAWNLIYSYYKKLPYAGHGLMTAREPWSGYYEVSSPIWTTAHTTQFTQIGWRYLGHGAGVGLLDGGGSYVTLVSPDTKDVTIVIETMNTASNMFCMRPPQDRYLVKTQNITLVLKGHLSGISALHLWFTQLGLGEETSTYFKYTGTVKTRNSQVSFHAAVNSVYTLTTIASGHHGSFDKVVTKSASFPLPYMDNFEDYAINGEAYNFAQQVGVFEIIRSKGTGHSKVMQQVMINAPIFWCPLLQTIPLNIIGNYNWTDVQTTVDVLVPSEGATRGVYIAVRVDQGGCTTFWAKGIFFFLHFESNRLELTHDLAQTMSIDEVKTVLKYNTWYTISLKVKDKQVMATIDDKTIFKHDISHFESRNGFVGLGTENFGIAQFDNFVIKSAI